MRLGPARVCTGSAWGSWHSKKGSTKVFGEDDAGLRETTKNGEAFGCSKQTTSGPERAREGGSGRSHWVDLWPRNFTANARVLQIREDMEHSSLSLPSVSCWHCALWPELEARG
jgi:hypothetical protein